MRGEAKVISFALIIRACFLFLLFSLPPCFYAPRDELAFGSIRFILIRRGSGNLWGIRSE